MPDVPGPEDVEPTADRMRRLHGASADEDYWRGPIDIRYVGPLTAEVTAASAERLELARGGGAELLTTSPWAPEGTVA